MADRLTAKQEAFAVEYVQNGGNGSAAYRHAYDASAMTDKSVWEKASELRHHGKVSARIDQLFEAKREVIQWTDTERLKRLKKAADREGADNDRAAIAAIAEANKMLGSHAAEKKEITGKNGGSIKVEATSLTDEQLAAIAAGSG